MDQDINKAKVESTFPVAQPTQKSPMAMVVGIVSVLVVLLVAGWYMMGMQTGTPAVTTQPAQETSTVASVDAAAAALSTQSSSDEVTAIDADLSATDLGSLDDLNKI